MTLKFKPDVNKKSHGPFLHFIMTSLKRNETTRAEISRLLSDDVLSLIDTFARLVESVLAIQ